MTVSHNSIKNAILFVILSASLIPIASESGIQANYVYLLIFVLPFIRFRPSQTGMILLGFYAVVFLTGIVALVSNGFFYFSRTTASFIAFLLPLLLAMVKIDDNFFAVFKKAVVFVSIVYSMVSIYKLTLVGYSGDFHMTKDIVGSQRFGFILIFAFFLVMFNDELKKFRKLVLGGILVIGILLTFSRASFVAFALTIAFMILTNIHRIKVSYVINGAIFCIVMLVVFYDTVIGQIVTFFTDYLLSFRDYNLTARETSEGYRVYVFKQIANYVLAHPLFGSHFAGLYLIYPEYATTGASSHGQYNDTLLRTGLVGLAVYLLVFYYMLRHFARNNSGIFYGLLGIFFYGFFHETFKLGHASIIYGVMLGYYLTRIESARASVSTKGAMIS